MEQTKEKDMTKNELKTLSFSLFFEWLNVFLVSFFIIEWHEIAKKVIFLFPKILQIDFVNLIIMTRQKCHFENPKNLRAEKVSNGFRFVTFWKWHINVVGWNEPKSFNWVTVQGINGSNQMRDKWKSCKSPCT